MPFVDGEYFTTEELAEREARGNLTPGVITVDVKYSVTVRDENTSRVTIKLADFLHWKEEMGYADSEVNERHLEEYLLDDEGFETWGKDVVESYTHNMSDVELDDVRIKKIVGVSEHRVVNPAALTQPSLDFDWGDLSETS
jgi:hypothetical protein